MQGPLSCLTDGFVLPEHIVDRKLTAKVSCTPFECDRKLDDVRTWVLNSSSTGAMPRGLQDPYRRVSNPANVCVKEGKE